MRELSRSLQLNDKDAQAHKILGLVCTFVGRYDLAEVELRSAAQLEPKSPEIHYFLGRVYYTRQVFSMAVHRRTGSICHDGDGGHRHPALIEEPWPHRARGPAARDGSANSQQFRPATARHERRG